MYKINLFILIYECTHIILGGYICTCKAIILVWPTSYTLSSSLS